MRSWHEHRGSRVCFIVSLLGMARKQSKNADKSSSKWEKAYLGSISKPPNPANPHHTLGTHILSVLELAASYGISMEMRQLNVLEMWLCVPANPKLPQILIFLAELDSFLQLLRATFPICWGRRHTSLNLSSEMNTPEQSNAKNTRFPKEPGAEVTTRSRSESCYWRQCPWRRAGSTMSAAAEHACFWQMQNPHLSHFPIEYQSATLTSCFAPHGLKHLFQSFPFLNDHFWAKEE